MHCPFCNKSQTSVLESRIIENGNAVRRRRRCSKCGKRFTTLEKIKATFLWVVKKDGRKEIFDREKIKRGIVRAVLKRPVTMIDVEGVVEDVEKEMLKKENSEVRSKEVGNAILKRLKKLDKVAWLRFASVYLEFTDLNDFKKAIQK